MHEHDPHSLQRDFEFIEEEFKTSMDLLVQGKILFEEGARRHWVHTVRQVLPDHWCHPKMHGLLLHTGRILFGPVFRWPIPVLSRLIVCDTIGSSEGESFRHYIRGNLDSFDILEAAYLASILQSPPTPIMHREVPLSEGVDLYSYSSYRSFMYSTGCRSSIPNLSLNEEVKGSVMRWTRMMRFGSILLVNDLGGYKHLENLLHGIPEEELHHILSQVAAHPPFGKAHVMTISKTLSSHGRFFML